MTEQEYRYAADQLLQSNSHESNSQNVQSPTEISHSHSINTLASIRPEYILSSGDYFAGVRPNGRMSNVRRFFCLFVTFDLTFISLMWLIIIMINGENIVDALTNQVVHYDIHKSLFDIVLLAGCRFILLILFYAICYIHHWIIIALTTTCTCVFLISKVFVYDWHATEQQVFQVLLVLTSFVLSWGETWFLDYRVLPQELQASQIVIQSPESERAPLINRFVRGLPSMYTESIGNFYSPLQSATNSMYHFDVGPSDRFPAVNFTAAEISNYVSQGETAMRESQEFLNSPNWKKSKAEGDDIVEWLQPAPKARKIFKLTSVVNIPPKYLFEELFYRVETMPEWNPALMESYRVQVIDEHTDISYQISANGARGAVSSRDFINLRQWKRLEDGYAIASVSTSHPSLNDKNVKCIRGENGVGCWMIRAIPTDPNSCVFVWVLNTDLKGWINSTILEVAFVNMMFDYIKNLRKYITKLRQTGRIL
ncbi:steroidogenic acute regulatory protein-like isoform X1 [Atheta coriaria]|uniref:steroidogenic acute regulatory protein-like isoform X1 n=1 Tax=Dalotia coriaria TaxID=877792 RepID=UPI0031F3FB7C